MGVYVCVIRNRIIVMAAAIGIFGLDPGVCAEALAQGGTEIPIEKGEHREQQRLSLGEINDRALKIRAELDKAFNMFLDGGKADHADKLTAIFAPYISAGMAFEDAEKILEAVGFTTLAGAGEEYRRAEKDQYAVVAEIPRFSQRVFGSVEAYVTPLPLAEGLAEYIGRRRRMIYYPHP